MSVELSVKDVRATILNYDLYVKHGAGLFYDFFKFGDYQRNFSNPTVLQDCFFYNLHITYYVREWGPHAPPPHPGFFEDFFPTILGRIVGAGNTLTLFVKSSDPDYFDERNVIKDVLAPMNLRYILLPNSILPEDRRTEGDVGHLIFEWRVESLDYVVEQWFMSPQVTIEGYVSRESPLPRIEELYFQPDKEERIRELLRTIEMGFRLWPDNNGMFVLTDRLDIYALKRRLQLSDLNPMLQEAARRYEATSQD